MGARRENVRVELSSYVAAHNGVAFYPAAPRQDYHLERRPQPLGFECRQILSHGPLLHPAKRTALSPVTT